MYISLRNTIVYIKEQIVITYFLFVVCT
jgi:hypothetical protein